MLLTPRRTLQTGAGARKDRQKQTNVGSGQKELPHTVRLSRFTYGINTEREKRRFIPLGAVDRPMTVPSRRLEVCLIDSGNYDAVAEFA